MPANSPKRNGFYVHGRCVHDVPIVINDVKQDELIVPHMQHDAHVVITHPECVPQGLRLGDWSQVKNDS